MKLRSFILIVRNFWIATGLLYICLPVYCSVTKFHRGKLYTAGNKADFAAIVREIIGTGENRVMNFNYAPAQ